MVFVQYSKRGEEVIRRIFRVQTNFNGMATELHLILGQRQHLAPGHLQLPTNQVGAGDGLSYGMFHLQPGVHLQEEELTGGVVEQVFHSACAEVTNGLHQLHRRRSHSSP